MLRIGNIASERSVEPATGALDRADAVDASGGFIARIRRARQEPARLTHRQVVDMPAVPHELSTWRDRGPR